MSLFFPQRNQVPLTQRVKNGIEETRFADKFVLDKGFNIDSDDPAANVNYQSPSWFSGLIKYRRRKLHQNTLVFVLGRPGSGKSYTALTLGERTDRTTDFKSDHCVFWASDFIRLVNERPTGCVIVSDESGVSQNARKFMSPENIGQSAVLQTFRNYYINPIFTTPFMTLQDINARQLCTFSVLMRGPGLGIIFSHWVDAHKGKSYRKNLGFVRFMMPFLKQPEELVRYEAKKREYQHTLYQSEGNRVKRMESIQALMPIIGDPPSLMKHILDDVDLYIDGGTDKISEYLVKGHNPMAKPAIIRSAIALIKQRYELWDPEVKDGEILRNRDDITVPVTVPKKRQRDLSSGPTDKVQVAAKYGDSWVTD